MRTCSICAKGQIKENLFKVPCIQTGEIFNFGRCDHCAVEIVLDQPPDINKYYINTHMRQRRSMLYYHLKNLLLSFELARIRNILKEDSVIVDIGCGVGEFVKVMDNNHLKVIASDSGGQRPMALSDHPHVPFLDFDFINYTIKGIEPISDGVVVLRHVLEHLSSPEIFFDRMIDQNIKACYIVVPNQDCLEARLLKEYYFAYDPPRHLWQFNKSALTMLLERKGFEIQSLGFDTIPSLIPSFYRYISLKGLDKNIAELFHPQGLISTLSAPINFIFPNNVLWVTARRK